MAHELKGVIAFKIYPIFNPKIFWKNFFGTPFKTSEKK